MKITKILRILVGASVLMISCAKEECREEVKSLAESTFSGTVETAETKADLKYSDGSGYEVSWDMGDRIAICGSNGNSGVYEATTSGASTTFEKVSGEDPLTPGYTAYYPAANYVDGVYSLPFEQTYSDSEVKIADFPMVAYSPTHALAFKNMCAVMKINVKAKEDMSVYDILVDGVGFGLSGAVKDLAFDEETGVPTYTVEGSRGVRLFCGDAGVEIKEGETKAFFVAVPPINNRKVKVTVRTTGLLSQTLSATVTLNRAKVKNASVKCSEMVWDYCYGESNCYVAYGETNNQVVIDITPYIIDVNKMRSGVATNAPTVDKASILWNNDGGIIAEDPVLNKAANTVTVNLDGTKFGNACVSIYDEDNTVLWSYVIWKPEISPFESLLVYNEMENDYAHYKVMPLSIGATNTVKMVGGVPPAYDENAVLKAYGLYYQYGRPNAFQRFGDNLSAPFAFVREDYKIEFETMGLYDDVMVAKWLKEHPTTFVGNHAMYNQTKKPEMWSPSAKTAFDPCPKGYKIPDSGCFASIFYNANNRLPFGEGNYYINDEDGSARASADGGFFLYYQYVPSLYKASPNKDLMRTGETDFYPWQHGRYRQSGKISNNYETSSWVSNRGSGYYVEIARLSTKNQAGTVVGTESGKLEASAAECSSVQVRCVLIEH